MLTSCPKVGLHRQVIGEAPSASSLAAHRALMADVVAATGEQIVPIASVDEALLVSRLRKRLTRQASMHPAMSGTSRAYLYTTMALALCLAFAVPLWVAWPEDEAAGIVDGFYKIATSLAPAVVIGGVFMWGFQKLARLGAPPRRSVERLRRLRTLPEPLGAVGDWAE